MIKFIKQLFCIHRPIDGLLVVKRTYDVDLFSKDTYYLRCEKCDKLLKNI